MKIFKSLIPFAVLFIFGCKNEVKEISKEIDTNFDNELSTDLKSVVATMSFYKFAIPENYWYEDGTTARDILNDEFRFGYKRLSDLKEAVSQIETSNKQIIASIDTLHNRIIKEQRKIKKTQKALEQVNSMFGLGSIGGVNALYDFSSLNSNNNTDDEDITSMPKEIQEALENLRETIQSSNSEFLFKTHQFEIKMVGSAKITDEQMTSIRLHLKKSIKEKVRQFYIGSDTTFINNSTLDLLNSYDELFSTKAIKESNVHAENLSNKSLTGTVYNQPEQGKVPSDFLPKGYVIFEKINRDLNKDGIEDCVLIIKGTDKSKIIKDEYRGELDRNRRGIIILFNRNSHYELAVKNYTCFSSEHEDGGVYFAPELSVKINKGNLNINYDHGRYGSWGYTFKFQNLDFELIGYDFIENRGPVINKATSINFLTEKKQIKQNINENAEGGDEVYNETWEKIQVDKLVKISEVKDFDELNIL